MKLFLTIAISVIIALLIIVFLEQFSAFGIALLLIDIAIIKLYLIDKYLLKGFDTFTELKNKNVAVAITLLAYSLLICTAIFSSFVVWR